ncbi:circularly permuted type 2 ATP-grasp protein [Falsiroseomonas selenitidurans]|uniref:Circularly permuted type 2 ATP-grasp protein n=1 Tax=Falsiroseomonas selenitidurans TaxID=2716335 RepID=A0ABX1E291_9PROT|nr:circularly permuted type 2 ATP-grasp protein [Falsiroseomonas selenitidurans]NKC30898.1 circularly permuted type 2 ATP-grasp protein [Falsiroseomonas selenitidurans]
MVDGRGQIRPHWRGLLGAFSSLGYPAVAERARRLDRAFEEEGVATVLADSATRTRRPWRCDPVPLILPAREFAVLEQGLAQRARLLAALLDDLYGPQTLLAQGLLPATLVFGNPHFLRPCRAPAATRFPRLTFYGADLLRGPDGTWRVLADRCGGANGVGFAAENRNLLARALPEAFRAVQVRTLRPFFDTWLDALQALAPGGADNPRLALLTPGAKQETWLEHLFLSRELGLELVETGDLTVRDGAVFLKTLRGLRRIDVIMRRIKGELSDPLEFSGGGVPGLMQTMRDGAVRMVNAPGSMLAEMPGAAPYLPSCGRALLGEELLLEGLETLWMGDAAARARVQAAPEAWRLRSAFEPGPPVPLGALEVFSDKGSAAPWMYAATRPLPPSAAPQLVGEALEPAPVVLRMFLACDAMGNWQAMPGGLAHVLEGGGAIAGPPPRRGSAKDVWVIAEDAHDIVGPAAPRAAPLAIRRASGDLPSRVADDLYWLGRYVERLDASARLLRALLARLLRGPALPREIAEVRALARCLNASGLIDAEAAASPADGTALPRALRAAAGPGGALLGLLEAVERPQVAVRDRLTHDMWTAFAHLIQEGRARLLAGAAGVDALAGAATAIIRFCNAVSGIAAENMVRGGAWMFLDLGRRIERATATARNLAHALDQPPQRLEAGLRLALEICDSTLTYRARYLAAVQPAPVLDLVLADPGNPRALGYQLSAVSDRLAEIGGPDDTLAATAAGLAARPQALVDAVLVATDRESATADLPAALHALEAETAALSDAVARRYVSHIRTHSLGEADPGAADPGAEGGTEA